MRHSPENGGWNVVRMNIATLEDAKEEFADMKANNPKGKLRILQVTETVVEEG
jgi:hypothetical protein